LRLIFELPPHHTGGDAGKALARPLGGRLHRDAEFLAEDVEDDVDRVVRLIVDHEGLALGTRDQRTPIVLRIGGRGEGDGEQAKSYQTTGHVSLKFPVGRSRP
jgi:hypothetical protein